MAEGHPSEPSGLVRPPIYRLNADPVPLPQPFATALAQIVVEWSRLEDAISSDTATTMQMFPPVAEMAAEAPRSFRKKLDLWKKASKRAFNLIPEYCQIVDQVAPRAQNAARFRNHLIHGHWPVNGTADAGEYHVTNFEGLAVRPDGMTMGRYSKMKVTQAVLDELVAEILDLSGLVSGFTATRMLHAHHGLLKARREPSAEGQTRPSLPTPPKP